MDSVPLQLIVAKVTSAEKSSPFLVKGEFANGDHLDENDIVTKLTELC